MMLLWPALAFVIPLVSSYQRDGNPVGFVLHARLNRVPVKLLLDSGASSVVLTAESARRVGLVPQGESRLGGIDPRRWTPARRATGATLEAGEVTLCGIEVDIVADRPAFGADGLVGTDVFRDHQIRLDGRRRTLELLPPGDADPGGLPMRRVGHAILVPVRVNGRSAESFLLDSGAAYSVVDSSGAVPGLDAVSLNGITGQLTAQSTTPTHFRVGGYSTWERDVVAMDLGAMNRLYGIQIKGMIGYPVLSRSILTIDYRNERVRLSAR